MTNYAKIDHTNHRIILDRTFEKNALIVGSDEYKMLQACRKDYPEYTVVRRTIKKNPNQERYRGLTYAFMEEYIRTHESRDTVNTVINEFNEMRLISQAHSKAFRYPVIKQWFLEQYPEFLEFRLKPAEDKPVKIVSMNNDTAAANLPKGA